MPRFVILEHDHPELHWDLLLEDGSALKAWRLARPPENKGAMIDALQLPDHRLHYLDYEGPISGNRGAVKRWDAGTYEFRADESGQALHLQFDGTRLHGPAVLERVGTTWVFRLG
jgi:hypothetical protein